MAISAHEAIDRVLRATDDTDDGKFPVIFNGVYGPRMIGYASCQSEADQLLFAQRLSAEKISFGRLKQGSSRQFIICH